MTGAARERLARYEAKRDFQKTAEPRGDAPVRPSKALRFVVQRHDARRLHYDLRLELDGVFKSWAVTKGPSLNPADKRLAVEVEDHPLGYGDFEGTIPKGQYGGGTVQLFDRGTWIPEGSTPPAAALAAGELKFELRGKRLNGSFVLVRLRKDRAGGTRPNWLLIKHRDAAANDREDGGGILAIETSVASGRDLATIAAGKGRRPSAFMLATSKAPRADAVWTSDRGHATAGRQAKTAAGAADPRPERRGVKEERAAMPEFVAPQLCASADKPPGGRAWLHEVKFDGYRIQVRIEDGRAALRTRTGLDWTTKFPEIARGAAALPDAILDGEVVALDAQGRPDFSALQAALASGRTDALVFFVFDLLFLDGEDLRDLPLAERKGRLAEILARVGSDRHLRFVEHFDADGAAVFRSACEMGLEGIVSKKAQAPYRSGRGDRWVKIKARPTHDVVVGAWTETGGAFRSLIGGVFREGRLVHVGRIGSGFGASKVAALMPKLAAHARKTSPFDPKASPPRDRAIHWLDPVLVAEIEFAGWSSDGLVRQAAFRRLREDLPAREIVAAAPSHALETAPIAQQAQAPTPPARRAGRVAVHGVSLSHPDKPLWPDAGDEVPVTKADLARYYAAVASWMLPHVAGRPCSIVRAPDGIEGQHFFQRHAMAGGSGLLGTIKIAGDRKAYLTVDGPEALIAVAQSGGLELHPGNGAPGRPAEPDRLVFDLDPAPELAFAEVVATAKALRVRLEALGLSAFCKTTGGKGLHVVVPLASSSDVSWGAAKAFARALCVAMEREEPGRFLVKASKAARRGKIFLDYLRNDELSTAVAPLSPRARPHAPVSMPLSWAQVRIGLDPSRFTVRTVPKLLARSTAWEGYEAARAPLAPAIARLGKG